MADPQTHTPQVPGDSLAQHRELRDAREQLGATREILVALGRSSASPDEILDVVVDRAARLCDADAGLLNLREGDVFVLSRTSGEIPAAFLAYQRAHPVTLSRSSVVGRVALERRTQQIPDVLSDREYGRGDLQRIAGYRTLLSAPMILQDEVVGVLSVWRTDVAPFDDRELALLEEFAVHGAIVLRQFGLTRSLELRTDELAGKVAQLEARTGPAGESRVRVPGPGGAYSKQ